MKNFLEYTRDYKDEYKKFQSSPERIKYRAELVKYNRDKGTYGNGDGKDASHKDGKIVGFEDQSKNRGRAEGSRLKGSKRNVDAAFDEAFTVPMGSLRYSKVNLTQVNMFISHLSRLLTKPQIIDKIKKKFDLKRVVLDTIGQKVLSFENVSKRFRGRK